jgi:hypothetical protein
MEEEIEFSLKVFEEWLPIYKESGGMIRDIPFLYLSQAMALCDKESIKYSVHPQDPFTYTMFFDGE